MVQPGSINGLLESHRRESSSSAVIRFQFADVKQARVTISHCCCAAYMSSESPPLAVSESRTLLTFGTALHIPTWELNEGHRGP